MSGGPYGRGKAPERKCMPLLLWPQKDLEVWKAATAGVDPFADSGGERAGLRKHSNRRLQSSYGRWMTFLERSGDLDRLSRDQEHIARVFKELSFAGAKIHTIAEGEISELHVGLKGTMNALFLKDLAAKTYRGMSGRIREKRAASGISYGYRLKREFDHRGEPIRGGRQIVEAEANIVRKVFKDFADGKSPRAIAKDLNAKVIAGPGGRP